MWSFRYVQLLVASLLTVLTVLPVAARATTHVYIDEGTVVIEGVDVVCQPNPDTIFTYAYTYRNVVIVTETPSGNEAYTSKLNLSFTLTPEGETGTTYTGHVNSLIKDHLIAASGGGAIDQFTLNIQGKGDDGSSFHGVLQGHIILTPSGEVHSTFDLKCT